MKVPELMQFESRIRSKLKQLQVEKEFCDVTLVCEDQQIQTHKMILAGGSLLFKNLLKENPHKRPIIYLPGVKFSHLLKIWDFLYQGEVKIDQNQLDDFLSVAHYDHISLLLSRMLYSLENQSGSEWRRLTSSRQMKTF